MDLSWYLSQFASEIEFPFESSKKAAVRSLRVALTHLRRYGKEDEQDDIDEYLAENGSTKEDDARAMYLLAVELKKRHDLGEPKEEI